MARIHFYHDPGLYRVAVIIAQISIRYPRGQTQDPRFVAFGQVIPLVIEAAHDVFEVGTAA